MRTSCGGKALLVSVLMRGSCRACRWWNLVFILDLVGGHDLEAAAAALRTSCGDKALLVADDSRLLS